MTDWISVEDRLPEMRDTVLVAAKVGGSEDAEVFQAHYTSHKRHKYWAAIHDYIEYPVNYCETKWTVTHWMPLPSLPPTTDTK